MDSNKIDLKTILEDDEFLYNDFLYYIENSDQDFDRIKFDENINHYIDKFGDYIKNRLEYILGIAKLDDIETIFSTREDLKKDIDSLNEILGTEIKEIKYEDDEESLENYLPSRHDLENVKNFPKFAVNKLKENPSIKKSNKPRGI